jgi:hypothetical protein
VVALACWGFPLVLIGAWPVAALALAALVVTGISNAVLDVSGFTLVQRGVRNEDRVTIFGAMESLFGVALLTGSLLAAVLLAVLGTRAALIVRPRAPPRRRHLAPITRGRGERLNRAIALLGAIRCSLHCPSALDRLKRRALPRITGRFSCGESGPV